MSDSEDIFFVVHVPKTAGTAFYFYMRQNIPALFIYPGVKDAPETRLDLDALRAIPDRRRANLRAYLGHFPAFATELVGATRTVTLLRDPVERVISMLKMRQRPANPPTGNVLPRTPHMSLEEIYADPDVWPWLDNVQARLFAMQASDRPASFLDPVALDATRLDAAKERLASIEVVGVQEDWLGVVRDAERAFGWNPVSGHPRALVSEDVPVPGGLREQIAEDMVWDRELYAFAVELIARRRAA
ncbi:MAG TPA: hypothetical protein VF533_18650 [Solirubrobacteraceae bacterium]